MSRLLLPLLLLALPSTALSTAPDDEVDEARAELDEELADALYSLGKWCHKKRWYGERDRRYRQAIEADPDHKKARRALGYERRRDGTWDRDEPYEPQRNERRLDREDLAERVKEELEDWHEGVHELLAEHGDALSEEDRHELWQRVVRYYPEDEVAREALGHVVGWDGETWVSPEVMRSYERRKELAALMGRAREAGATVEPLEPREFEAKLTWSDSGRNDRARAFVHVDPDGEGEDQGDVKHAAVYAHAAEVLMNEGLGIEVELPEGLTYYLVEDEQQLVEVARAHPTASHAGLEGVGAAWLDWRSMVTWGETTPVRQDAVSRQTVSWLLKHRFELTPRQGWAFEGIGLYLSYTVCGTRLRFFVRESEYGSVEERTDMLRDPKVDWLSLALEVMHRKPPDLKFLLGKDVNNLSERDLLVSYALGAYLVEGRHEELPAILSRLPKEPATVVLEDVLGLGPDELADELLQWLEALQT